MVESREEDLIEDSDMYIKTEEYEHFDQEKHCEEVRESVKSDVNLTGKRVTIKAIEFDWIFDSKEGY